MPTGSPGKPKGKYSGEFKQKVVEYMRENKLSYRETGRLFEVNHFVIMGWERIYLEAGAEGLYTNKRGGPSSITGAKLGKRGELSKAVEEDLIAENQRLKMEIDYLKKYYYVSMFDKADKHEAVKSGISKIYHENKGRYGYRRITMELRKRGYTSNHKTVLKLMKTLNLTCRVRMKRYKSYKGEVGRIAPNHLERSFLAARPNEKWATDITEFSLFGEKLYLSPIIDLYNGEVISYNLSRSPNFAQTVDMLESAFTTIPDNTKLILHSDQGWQYQMKQYRKMLAKKGIIQSMSRKGNCLDNAPIESFFAILKSELLYLQKFDNTEHFIAELNDYLHYYNHKRIKAKLKGLSPVQFRTQSSLAA